MPSRSRPATLNGSPSRFSQAAASSRLFFQAMPMMVGALAFLEPREQRMLGEAGRAPAGEEIDQHRLARPEQRVGEGRLALAQRRQVEPRRGPADQHRADRRGIAAGQQRPGEEARHQGEGQQRQEEEEAAAHGWERATPVALMLMRRRATGVARSQRRHPRSCHSAACTTVRRDGAPMRRRRSLKDTKPPSAQNAAPSQIQGASGLR